MTRLDKHFSKNKKRGISIKYKIWLAIMSTVLVVIATLWLLQVVFLEDYYTGKKAKDILSNAYQIKQAIDDTGLYGAGDELLKIGLHNTLCIDISNSDGVPIVQYEGLGDNCAVHSARFVKSKLITAAKQADGEAFSTKVTHPKYDTQYYTCAVLDHAKDGNDYIIVVTTTLAPMREAAMIIRNQLIYISGILVLVATAIAFFVARSMTKPIKKISDAAKQIAAGNLDVDVKVDSADEIGELSDSFTYMTKELAKVNVLQKELVANISHDMRTPLTMIKGYAETIKDITGDNKETRERQLDIIVEESNRLTNLVSNVMDLSLMQAGQSNLNIVPFEIAKLAFDVLGRFELLEQTKGITFETDLAVSNDTIVYADRMRIEQVLYNLINNAVNHIANEKIITICIKPNADSTDEIIVCVSDTGTGIVKEDLPLIWDRYYKPYKKTEQKALGTGLGLSIVKAILIHHGQQFGVNSTVGIGSTFWFTLSTNKSKNERNFERN